MGKGGKKKNKVILPPQLPPDLDDDEVLVSDEDVEFVKGNERHARALARLDRKSIDSYVTRVADHDEDEVERRYEERESKRQAAAALRPRKEEELEVDRVDALPVKTLQGELVYKNTAKKARSDNSCNGVGVESKSEDKGADVKKSTKNEEWNAKPKNIKRDGKLQNVQAQIEAPNRKLHSEVLEEVKEELSTEELFEKKKAQLAEIGMSMLEDPEANIRSLNDLVSICNDKDQKVVKLGLMSLLAVFRDIIPSYRIRQLTEKELTVEVSKDVKKMRYYEYTLLRSYKAYLQKLISLERKPHFYHVAVRCMCTLLDTAPHFNFRESLLAGVVKNLYSSDDTVRKMCCETIRSLFVNEGKHRGEATIEAVRLIADHVKLNNCQLHPDSIEVFLSLRFDDDLGKVESEEEKGKPKKNKRRQNQEVPKQLPVSDKKKTRRELMSKTRQEVDAELRAVSFTLDPKERKRIQRETLSAIFETYFRILKHTMNTSNSRGKSINVSLGNSHPLLAPCLEGLGKFSLLIDVGFMGELIACLKKLSGYTDHQYGTPHDNTLSVSERLQCCIVAFKVWRSNLEALNVDLQDFFVQLFNLVLEYRPDRDRGEVLADALKTLLWEGKQQDMIRAAAFIKRLATFALSFGPAEAIAALITLRNLLQKNSKCRNMLENDAGGGSLSCLVAKYDPEAKDPYLSGALASVLWELSLLQKHYDASVSTMASNILSLANLNPTQNPVPISNANPLEAYRDLSMERELSKPANKVLPLSCKRKRRIKEFVALSPDVLQKADCIAGEDELKEKLQNHFAVLRGISENERLRAELNQALSSINIYREYKKQKKNTKSKTSKKKVAKV